MWNSQSVYKTAGCLLKSYLLTTEDIKNGTREQVESLLLFLTLGSSSYFFDLSELSYHCPPCESKKEVALWVM